MKVTYIGHSGVLVELENKALLFDYSEGILPDIPPELPLYVFVSHKHGDHYNRDILKLREKREQVFYIFSGDIMSEKKAREQDITRVIARQEIKVSDMRIRTLRSNDEGVAFLVYANGKVIYHSGDLNWWHWEGESEEDNHFMECSYKEEMKRLSGEQIDLAFVVLDPRQEKQFYWGFDWFMRHTDTKHIVPIHMWGEYDWGEALKTMPETEDYKDRIGTYHSPGEILEI